MTTTKKCCGKCQVHEEKPDFIPNGTCKNPDCPFCHTTQEEEWAREFVEKGAEIYSAPAK